VNISEFIVINDGVAYRVKEKRNNLSTRKRRDELDWIGTDF
jgi:hypothetical protein